MILARVLVIAAMPRAVVGEPTEKTKSVAEYMQDLQSPEDLPRRQAIMALRRLKPTSDDVLKTLNDMVQNRETDFDRREELRYAALAVLHALGDKGMAKLAACFAKNEVGPSFEAGYALRHLGPRAKMAVPVLIEMLKNSSIDARMAAADVLAAIGPEARAALPLLNELARKTSRLERKDRDFHGVRLCGKALAAIKRIDAVEFKKAVPDVLPGLTAALLAGDESTQFEARHAFEILGPLGKPALPEIKKHLKKTLGAALDFGLSSILANFGEDGCAVLIEAILDPQLPLKQRISLVNHFDFKSHQAGVNAAQRQALVGLCGSKEVELRKEALYVMRQWGPEEALPALLAALHDKDLSAEEHQANSWALAKRGAPAVAGLRKDFEVLYRLGKDARPALDLMIGRLWNYKNPAWPNFRVLKALPAFGPDAVKAMPQLLAILEKGPNWFREEGITVAACKAVAAIGPQAKMHCRDLRQLAKSADPDVAAAAAAAISKIEPR